MDHEIHDILYEEQEGFIRGNYVGKETMQKVLHVGLGGCFYAKMIKCISNHKMSAKGWGNLHDMMKCLLPPC